LANLEADEEQIKRMFPFLKFLTAKEVELIKKNSFWQNKPRKPVSPKINLVEK